MLNRRSSYKNQTCLILKNQTPPPSPTVPLPHSQSTVLVQRTNTFSHQEYGQSVDPLPRSGSTKLAQTTYFDSHDQKPLPRTQSTKFIQRTSSAGYGHHDQHVQPPLPHFESLGSQPTPSIQLTEVTSRTNSVGHGQQKLTHPTKVTQRTNSIGTQEQGRVLGIGLQSVPSTQSTEVTQRTNSVGGQHNYDHGPKMPVLKKPVPKVEFPVSPELETLVVGEGITNANHPQHTMVKVNIPIAFTCMGCKEYGAGSRFTCQQCNFELHDFCALAPPVLKAHPLHSQHQLLFNPKPGKGGLLRSKCDVCAKSENGYMFRCSACSFQLHPTCAMLSAKMNFPTHPHTLVILPASANSMLSADVGDLPCAECKRKRSGQVYRCTVCDYYLHAVCAKNMVNGLHANGIKGLDKPSRLGVAAKIASHVVVGFMGGLFEGIGEGLGEALTQNIVKGKCNTTRKSLYPGN